MGFTEILDTLHVDVEVEKDSKRCCRCKEVKPLAEFHRISRLKDGLCYWCRDCEREYKLQVKEKPKLHVQEKRCIACGEVKSIACFTKDMASRDGFGRRCKDCRKIYRVQHLQADPTLPQTKLCSRCGKVKTQQDFYRTRDKKSGLMSACKDCMNLNFRVAYAVRQADRIKSVPGQRFPKINSWDQVGDILREMAEMQVEVNRQRDRCEESVNQIKINTAAEIKPYILQQSRLQVMIERFIKKARRECKRLYREFHFGSVSFARNKIDIRLRVKFAEERLGKP